MNTKIVRTQVVLEERDGQTLVSNKIFDSNYPMYVDTDNKLYQIIPSGKTIQRREVDPDSLNDTDGIKFLGAAIEMSDFTQLIVTQRNFSASVAPLTEDGTYVIAANNISNAQTNGFKTDTRFDAASDIIVDYPTEAGKIALESGANFEGAITNIEVVNGIVKSVS